MAAETREPSRQSLRALDALNLVLADVRDGLGPYLAIYLATKHWDAGRIGLVMATMGIASVVAQAPAGWLIDRTRHKQALMVAASVLVALASVVMVQVPTLPAILGAQTVLGVATTVFAPAIAAVSLGIVGHARMARRTGRNEAFNHAGNVIAAILAGIIGDRIAYEGIFFLLAGMCGLSIISTLCIRRDDIDDRLARGEAEDAPEGGGITPLGQLLRDRRIVVFAAAVVLFHFANAAMLPLVGQKLTTGQTEGVAGTMSACIIAAQVVMVPVALAASRLAETWGRRPTFLIGFAILPIRGFLYTLTDDPHLLVAIQLLDGIGAGIFGVVGVLCIADLTRGTGQFNLMQGSLAAATGVGAAASNYLTGLVAARYGFDVGFAVLAGIAAAALIFYAWAMPETRPEPEPEPSSNQAEPGPSVATYDIAQP